MPDLEDSQEQMDSIMEQPIHIKGPKKALTAIKEIAHKNFKREICGFLGFDEEKKEYLVQLEENISENPSNFFLIKFLIIERSMRFILRAIL